MRTNKMTTKSKMHLLISLLIRTSFKWFFEEMYEDKWRICMWTKYREKSLRHVVMVAKFFDDNKPKTSLKKWIRTASNFIDLIQFHLIWRNFLGLNPKGPYLSLEEEKDNFCVVFTYSIKQACEIRKFHVAGVQRRQRNVQNSVMHVQSCCFVNKNLLLFCRSPSVAVVVGFVVIQK